MCRHLYAAGATLTVHNRARAVAEALASELPGIAIADSPRALAARAEIVIVNVADTAAVEAVVAASPDGLLAGIGAGTLVVDMGTTAVSVTRRLAAQTAAAGGAYVDAPVSGGVVGAEAASLTIMVGADEHSWQRVRPVLSVLGRHLTRCGDVGAGQVAKTANQMIVGLTIAAVAEAFALARAAGVEPARLRQALAGGFADSRILDVHGARMIADNFVPGGRATLQRKDIRQALDLAREVGIELPSTATNLELWERMIAHGWGDLDHSGLIKIYERP